jgi:peptidoglycan hydrolase-like protein with peptidoglycan-binding domain
MFKNISISKLSDSFAATAGVALILAMTMMAGFQHAEASTVNILTGANLTVGSTGAEVAALQGVLSEMGYLVMPSGVAPGYYGSLTRGAVANYQSGRGVSPALGYFGPLTKISMHEDFAARGWLSMMNW